MNKANRTALKEKCTKIILSHGCETIKPLFKGDEFRVMFSSETKIGPLSVTLDIQKGSKVLCLFCQFHDAAKAKPIFGHWKVNLNEFESPNFDLSVDAHLAEILTKANN